MPPTVRRSRALVAGLCCTAAAATILTAIAVWMVVAWLTFEPPPDMEGPSVFAAMLMVIIVTTWTGLGAMTGWIIFSDVLRRFPRGRGTSVGLLVGIAAAHGLFAAWMWSDDAALEFVAALGAVVPLTVVAAVLLGRAPGPESGQPP
jgi:hypothetical protein